MTFTNLYKITVKQKWQLNAWRSALCFRMLLLRMKTLTTKAQRRDAPTFRLTGVGPSLMKTSVLIPTSTQAGGRGSFLRHVRRMTDSTKLHLLKAEADMLGWGRWIIRPGQECGFCNLVCQVSEGSLWISFLCDNHVKRIRAAPWQWWPGPALTLQAQ